MTLLECCTMWSGRSLPVFQRCWVITMMMEAASTSETSVNFYQTTWRTTSQKTAVFVIAAVRTWNLTSLFLVFKNWKALYIGCYTKNFKPFCMVLCRGKVSLCMVRYSEHQVEVPPSKCLGYISWGLLMWDMMLCRVLLVVTNVLQGHIISIFRVEVDIITQKTSVHIFTTMKTSFLM
jgi:hypothetical protein